MAVGIHPWFLRVVPGYTVDTSNGRAGVAALRITTEGWMNNQFRTAILMTDLRY